MGFFSKGIDKKKPQPRPGPPKAKEHPAPRPASKAKHKAVKEARAVSETIIAEGTELIGEVTSDKTVEVHGKIKGKISIKSDLFVAETGHVEADVEAQNVTISGRISGKTIAMGLFELKSTGTLEGEVAAKSVKIDEGGRMIGKIGMYQGSGGDRPSEDKREIQKKREKFLGSGQGSGSKEDKQKN